MVLYLSEKKPVKKVISQYSYFRNGKRIVVPPHSRTYYKGRKPRPVPQRKFNEIRALHQKRPYDVRKRDEATTEPFGSEDDWKRNAWRWDYPNVDEAIPENLSLDWDSSKPRSPYIFVIDKYSGKELGHVWLDIAYDGKNAWVKEVEVNPDQRGQGISNIMLRELTNWADKNKIRLRLKAEPYGFEWDDEAGDYMRIDSTPSKVRRLSRYYKQFGFKPDRGVEKDANDNWVQFMTRRPQRI